MPLLIEGTFRIVNPIIERVVLGFVLQVQTMLVGQHGPTGVDEATFYKTNASCIAGMPEWR